MVGLVSDIPKQPATWGVGFLAGSTDPSGSMRRQPHRLHKTVSLLVAGSTQDSSLDGVPAARFPRRGTRLSRRDHTSDRCEDLVGHVFPVSDVQTFLTIISGYRIGDLHLSSTFRCRLSPRTLSDNTTIRDVISTDSFPHPLNVTSGGCGEATWSPSRVSPTDHLTVFCRGVITRGGISRVSVSVPSAHD